MTYGLVLEGGGAKGAYQIGSYMALLEDKLDIGAVVGSSIGALNGAFIVQEQADLILNIWKSQSFETGKKLKQAVDSLRSSKVPKAKDLVQTIQFIGEMDISPLKQLIYEYIDEDKIRESKLDYGLVIYSVLDRKAIMLFKDQIPQGQLREYLLASCCYPGFAPVKIMGRYYVDGGIGNNLPFEMVQKRGYIPLILRTNPTKIEDKLPQDAIVIGPKFPVAHTMDFDPIGAEDLIQRGYRQGRRILEGKDGFEYCFAPIKESQAFEILLELFFKNKEDFLYMAQHSSPSLERKILEGLLPKLAKELGLGINYSYKEFLLAFVEDYADSLKIDKTKTYTIEEMIFKLKNHSEPIYLTNRKGYLSRC